MNRTLASITLMVAFALVILCVACGGGTGSDTSTTIPVAAFTFAPGAPVVAQTVIFTDASTSSATSWSWSFGDGSTSTTQNPTHAYSAPGSFAVTLTASNAEGSNTASQDVIVSPGSFSLMSDVGADGGELPADYTCDGTGSSPALSWSGAPAGTKEFALLMTTLPGDGTTKWNWVLYGIPATTTSLAKNSSGIGILGVGSHGSTMAYEPPCSQGPGAKLYTFTLYALSESPQLPDASDQVTGEVLTEAISSITLGSATLNLSYTRP
jgi:PKD repeat protein